MTTNPLLMKNLRIKYLSLSIVFLALGCQQDEIQVEDAVDTDMVLAWELANDFLNSSRTESTDQDVTVLKMKQDEPLSYKTNTIQGPYQPLGEMTITAETYPGGYIFWHAGGGIQTLIEIEFDDASEELLDDSEPFEVVPCRMWALYIPQDFDPSSGDILKYDIEYVNKDGQLIRLDPKIKIRQFAD